MEQDHEFLRSDAAQAGLRPLLETYAARYRKDLLESVIPFWLKHAPDRQCGGYFTCLDRDGTIYDTRIAAGFTLKQMVELVGTSQSVISRLEDETTTANPSQCCTG